MTAISCFFVEFTGTAILLLMIAAATDNHNMAPPNGLLPLTLFFVVLGLGAALGMQTCKYVDQSFRSDCDAINTFSGCLQSSP